MVPTLTGNEALSPENPPRFDPLHTRCWTGRIPETFRKRPNATRSIHPTHSVAAIGAAADQLTRDHIYSITPCDQLSPYGKLAQRENSYILLLGVDHNANTTMHHVEEIVGVNYHIQKGFAEAILILEHETITRHYLLHRYGTERDFNVMDVLFSERGIQRATRIGAADIRLIAVKPMVQLVIQCLRADPYILCRK
jgi:aminoglycoside 3-N-acetyltransferase